MHPRREGYDSETGGEYERNNKKLVPDPLTKDIVIRVFNLYLEGKSHQAIANIFNNEKVFGKTNWYDSTIQKIKQILCRILVECEYLDNIKSETLNPVYLYPELENAIRENGDYIALAAFNCFA